MQPNGPRSKDGVLEKDFRYLNGRIVCFGYFSLTKLKLWWFLDRLSVRLNPDPDPNLTCRTLPVVGSETSVKPLYTLAVGHMPVRSRVRLGLGLGLGLGFSNVT